MHKNKSQDFYQFQADGVSFKSHKALKHKTIYAPLCGPTAESIKSSITPHLSGDIKINKFKYITKPTSREDLRNPVRDFFVYNKDKGVISLSDDHYDEDSYVEVGQFYHTLVKNYSNYGLQLQATNFIPVSGEQVELMSVKVVNTSKKDLTLTPTVSIPLFARALANKHDHEHVTSLLHRIQQDPQGIVVDPVMSFSEEGHQENNDLYFVLGATDKGKNPKGSFPTVQSFYGDDGSAQHPVAVTSNLEPKELKPEQLNGQEAVGALRFDEITLKSKEEKEYFILIGLANDKEEMNQLFTKFNSPKKFNDALNINKEYWKAKSHSIHYKTASDQFDAWMHWVTIQPVLRRIFGCSFLPDHDYGKGGKGWRDIWQDLLSLILIEPQTVRDILINNYAGVRIDGSNATIIGSKLGEFIADRNDITRVWMDHGTWPFITTLLYIHQTGDFDILVEENSYFRDPQFSRSYEKDASWNPQYGHQLKDLAGNVYSGSILEHILIQNLVQFFNVGEHNLIRLESADWNDGLDMAYERGESVAFMSFYGGNLMAMADLLEEFSKNKGIEDITLAKETLTLLDTLSDQTIKYDNIEEKRGLLFKEYFKSVQPKISGDKVEVKIVDVVSDLRKKGTWIFQFIRDHEKVTIKEAGKKFTWFNGYYDNRGERVEGKKDKRTWMTLTGQVFPIMSGLANKEEISQVVESVDEFLKDEKLGGYRLNTDFGLRHYLDLGRAFGFAFGAKENGAFFSHMTVMYAYGLYKQGFAKEGYAVLKSIYEMCVNTDHSKIYPGIPEYFDSQGQGMYHFLTGSASWFVLTMLTQVYGVRGMYGDLLLDPKLMADQFDEEGIAQVSCQFADHNLVVSFHNPKRLNYKEYQINSIKLNGKPVSFEKSDSNAVVINRSVILKEKSERLVFDIHFTA